MIKTKTIIHTTSFLGLILTLLNSIALTGVDLFNFIFPICALIASNYFVDKLNRMMLESCRYHHKAIEEIYRKNNDAQNQLIAGLFKCIEKLKEGKC